MPKKLSTFTFSSHIPNLHPQFSFFSFSFVLSLFLSIQWLPISELCLNKSWVGVRLAFSYLFCCQRDARLKKF
ncbi:hypothetical protein RJT34_15532 [Clitoria ternatea]|uniref:Uncharacterized protein n=1 Tax=Clitoria ternatea TaxID=43366 RepID=A0AAN9J6Z8_CLITE